MSNKPLNPSSGSLTSSNRVINVRIMDGDELPEFPVPVSMEIGLNAVASAVIAGINGMAKEGARSFEDYKAGKIDQTQLTFRVVSKGTEQALKGGTRTASGLALSEGAKHVLKKRFGEAVLKRFTRHNALTAFAFFVVDQSADTFKLFRGEIQSDQYKVNTLSNIGTTGGSIGGAAAGAVLGSVVPGLGTAVGAMLGSMLGAMSGSAGGQSLGEVLFKIPEKETEK
ncbi:MAG: hypothetical protein SF052_20165 [Bacteroidia bacterium]|nr:hypothetical protein [Bacteroidia bacterium]